MKIITDFISNRNRKKGAVIAFGNFDGVHLGHKYIINKVKETAAQQNYESAVLTFNPHPRKFFDPDIDGFYLTKLEQKISIIEKNGIDVLYIMDFTKQFASLSAESFIKDVLVDECNMKCIMVGNRCAFGKNKSGDISLLVELSTLYNYKVIELNGLEVEGITCSSSRVRQLLREGNIKQANELLGRNYTIQGIVEQGMQRGKTIGFPTINVSVDEYVKPKFGVYFAKVEFNEKYYYGVLNIGKRPTFDENHKTILEMHISYFNDSLYGEKVSVKLMHFIRSEQKFHNAEELSNQIKQDIIVAKQYCSW